MTTAAVIGHLLLLSGALLFLLPIRRLSPLPRGVTLVVCIGIGLARVGGLRFIAYPAGVLGDLSITTQILLGTAILKRAAGVDVLPSADRSFLLAAAAWTGSVLYVLSSGLTILDLYSLGFGSGWFMVALAIGIIACSRYRPGAALVIVLGVLAFDFGLLGSANVWDYVLDPVLVLFSWGWTLAVMLTRLRSLQGSHGPR
ncbi:MAG: hypothetical protein ACRD1X_18395 [Vicinamibacteria bacterium]